MDLLIKGKVSVVTAASKGLGRAVAEALAKEGVNLAICARNREQLLDTADYIRNKYNVDVLPIVCDVTNQVDIENFKQAVIDKFGTCHILFTNAGGPPAGSLKDFSGEDFKKAIELNLISTINLVNAFLPFMQNQKWGRVIASTSSNIRYLLPQYPLSNVSRVSVVSFIKTFAQEFAQFNITANVLAPGLFLTNPTKNDIEYQAKHNGLTYNEMLQKVAQTIPTKSIGDPKDFGALASFIASEHASFITGETFLIDGGQYSGVI